MFLFFFLVFWSRFRRNICGTVRWKGFTLDFEHSTRPVSFSTKRSRWESRTVPPIVRSRSIHPCNRSVKCGLMDCDLLLAISWLCRRSIQSGLVHDPNRSPPPHRKTVKFKPLFFFCYAFVCLFLRLFTSKSERKAVLCTFFPITTFHHRNRIELKEASSNCLAQNLSNFAFISPAFRVSIGLLLPYRSKRMYAFLLLHLWQAFARLLFSNGRKKKRNTKYSFFFFIFLLHLPVDPEQVTVEQTKSFKCYKLVRLCSFSRFLPIFSRFLLVFYTLKHDLVNFFTPSPSRRFLLFARVHLPFDFGRFFLTASSFAKTSFAASIRQSKRFILFFYFFFFANKSIFRRRRSMSLLYNIRSWFDCLWFLAVSVAKQCLTLKWSERFALPPRFACTRLPFTRPNTSTHVSVASPYVARPAASRPASNASITRTRQSEHVVSIGAQIVLHLVRTSSPII